MSFNALKKQAEAIRNLILAGGNIYEKPMKCQIQRNAISQRPFGNLRNSVNLQLVALNNGWNESQWITRKAINERELKLVKGSKPSWVIGWFPKKQTQAEIDAEKPLDFYAKAYRVYNIVQLEDYSMFVDESAVCEEDDLYDDLYDDLTELALSLGVMVDRSIKEYCYYVPSTDTIHMSDKSQFTSSNAACSVMLHELAHATGHSNRLNRTLNCDNSSKDYAREEGIADMAAFCLACHFGCNMNPGHHAAYVASWIKDDHSFLDEIIKEAMAVVSFVLNHKVHDKDESNASMLQNPACAA
jgi:antirestriction protein ArdC